MLNNTFTYKNSYNTVIIELIRANKSHVKNFGSDTRAHTHTSEAKFLTQLLFALFNFFSIIFSIMRACVHAHVCTQR